MSLEIAGLPSATTSKFAKTNVTGPTTLSIATTANTPGGTYPVTITGRSGGFVHTTTLQLIVQNTPGFGLKAAPATVVVGHPGGNATLITVTPTGGFSGPVSLTVTGLPVGITPTVGATNGGAYLTLSVSQTVAPGTYAFMVTGTNGNLSAAIGVSVQVV